MQIFKFFYKKDRINSSLELSSRQHDIRQREDNQNQSTSSSRSTSKIFCLMLKIILLF